MGVVNARRAINANMAIINRFIGDTSCIDYIFIQESLEIWTAATIIRESRL
jgi:hypothetical protein